jgi:alkylhydroperoxidase family enzyme
VAAYEASALDERVKAALRFADAFLADPGGYRDLDRLRAHFTPEQVVELALKLTVNAGNKASIALGLDEPLDAARLVAFDYDHEGNFVVERHRPSSR